MKLKIERLDNFGRGISYLDNKIIFIENALPGEVVDATKTFENKKISEGKVNEIIEKSDLRVEPMCPYYDKCGGCDIMHMSYDEQLKFKQNKVYSIFNKYFKNKTVIKDIVYSDEINYRNKATFDVNNKLCYKKKKSNEMVRIDYCYLLEENINNLIKIINSYDISKNNEVIIKAFDKEIMLVFNKNVSDELLQSVKDLVSSIYVKDNLVYGKPYVLSRIGKYKFIVSPKSFFQVNSKCVQKLYDKVYEYASEKKYNNILDLYCGTGTIGIYLSDLALNITGIEINKSSIEDANINKQINDINNINFICDTTSNINNQIKEKFDIVIVDPPRSGLDNNTINFLLQNESEKIIYVSCDIMTCVRDLNLLTQKYNVKEVTPVDMFPQTSHVETVCVLERKN